MNRREFLRCMTGAVAIAAVPVASVVDDRGRTNAQSGKHDDLLMAYAIVQSFDGNSSEGDVDLVFSNVEDMDHPDPRFFYVGAIVHASDSPEKKYFASMILDESRFTTEQALSVFKKEAVRVVRIKMGMDGGFV